MPQNVPDVPSQFIIRKRSLLLEDHGINEDATRAKTVTNLWIPTSVPRRNQVGYFPAFVPSRNQVEHFTERLSGIATGHITKIIN